MSESEVARNVEGGLQRLARLRERADRGRQRLARLRERAEQEGQKPDSLLLEAVEELGQALQDLSITLEDLSSTQEGLAEAKLEAQRHGRRYLDLFQFAPDAYVVTDELGVIRAGNAMAEQKLGRSLRSLKGKPLTPLVAQGDRDLFLACLSALREQGGPLEDRAIRFGSDPTFHASVSAVPELRDGSLEIRWILRDVSSQKDLETQLRQAAAATAVAEDRERRRIAADLHDDVAQTLSLVSIKLGKLRDAVPDSGVQEELGEMVDLLTQSRQRINSLSFQLSPPILHDVGLMAAAGWLVDHLHRSYGLKIDFEGDDELPLSEAMRVSLFRSLRELLINVARHAGTDEARVSAIWEGDALTVAVEDEGIGFVVGRSAGYGLLSIAERLEGLGGRLEIDSEVGRGTRVRMIVPVSAPERG